MPKEQELSSRAIVVGRVYGADADELFRRIADVERFPSMMEVVESTKIVVDDGVFREVDWDVKLRGSSLRWRERAKVSPADRSIAFEQITGDLDVFDGRWVVDDGPAGVEVRVDMAFRIGIPLLYRMLQPVAIEALLSNLTEMFRALEIDVTRADGFVGEDLVMSVGGA